MWMLLCLAWMTGILLMLRELLLLEALYQIVAESRIMQDKSRYGLIKTLNVL